MYYTKIDKILLKVKKMNNLVQSNMVQDAESKIGMAELLLNVKNTAPLEYHALQNFIARFDNILLSGAANEVFKDNTAQSLLMTKLGIASVDSGLQEIKEAGNNNTKSIAYMNEYYSAFHNAVEIMGGIENFVAASKIVNKSHENDLINNADLALKMKSTIDNSRDLQLSLQNNLTPEALQGFNDFYIVLESTIKQQEQNSEITSQPDVKVSEMQLQSRMITPDVAQYR